MTTRQPIRVLHVLGQMQPGGSEMRLLEVMRRLCPREFRADVCVLSGLPGSLDHEVRACGGEIIPLRLAPAFPFRFVQLLRRGGYQVVHSHVLHSSGAILGLAALARVPVRIAHFRGMHDGRLSTVRRRFQRRLMLDMIDRFATDIVGCGEGAMNAIWHRDWRSDSRCRIIFNAIDPSRFAAAVNRVEIRQELGIPVNAPLFIHVGNTVQEKNHTRLISIFREIKRIVPGSRLMLVGRGTAGADGAVGRTIRELGLQDCVTVLGVRHDVPRLLKVADALLLPSLREGLPGVVLEACAVGVPVLATDLPGIREVESRLELVRCLPLSASDAEWATVAAGLPHEAEQMRLRENAPTVFRDSVFHVDHAAAAHRGLWGRVLRQQELACS